jgi:hypothetical protein
MSEFQKYGGTLLDDVSFVCRAIGYLESWPPEERTRKQTGDDAIAALARIREYIEKVRSDE